MEQDMKRYSGILMHPSSLPGKEGIGTLGAAAYKWIDYLEKARQKLWQILPLGHTGYGDSPYQCFSTFAGNPILIDLQDLVEHGLLRHEDIPENPSSDLTKVDYGPVIEQKYKTLRKAYQKFTEHEFADLKSGYTEFSMQYAAWLDDYALFLVLKDHFGGKPWFEWTDAYRMRHESAMENIRQAKKSEIEFYKFCQFLFFKQWRKIRAYAKEKNISIIGDLPLYVALDSADAWSRPEVFQLDENRMPKAVAGVPPDYFSATGQLWGNPLYDWDALKNRGYDWWVERILACFDLYDILRIDHFRGFAAYWSVPWGDETAMNGKWIDGPGYDLFRVVEEKLGKLPIIAEDLGVITPDVEELRDRCGFPGMKVLHFAFHSKDGNQYLPHNYVRNAVVYTGTHDNNTTIGWYNEIEDFAKDNVHTYLATDGTDIHWKMIRLAWSSVAKYAVVPFQDILGLDKEGRMNIPGTSGGNWQWRFTDSGWDENNADILAFMTRLFDR